MSTPSKTPCKADDYLYLTQVTNGTIFIVPRYEVTALETSDSDSDSDREMSDSESLGSQDSWSGSESEYAYSPDPDYVPSEESFCEDTSIG